MRLSEARNHYYTYTGLASAATRQLAFAGIAIIWIFKVSNTQLPAPLRVPLVLLVATLALDLLHYSIASLIWGWASWKKERGLKNDAELARDPDLTFWKHINFPGLLMFWLKIVCVMTAYVFLFFRIMPLLFPQ